MATRAALAQPFSPPALLLDQGGMGGSRADGGPFVLPGGEALYFHGVESGRARIYRVAVEGEGAAQTLGLPVPMDVVDAAAQASVPVVSPDELTLFFTSDWKGDGVVGDKDIWMTSRRSREEAFGPPTKVEELNTIDDDVPNWISPDGCRLYLHRVNARRSWLYVASRPARQ